MNKAESKFYNTALKMHGAMAKLMERKEFENITVSEICLAAGVNRSTFYAHYVNTYDLLKEMLDEKLRSFFYAFGKEHKEIALMNREEAVFISPQYLLPYLQFIKKEKRFMKMFMSRIRSFDTGETYRLLLEKVFVPVYEKNGVTDETTIEYTAKFYLNGITAVVVAWLQNDCAEDIRAICEIIMMCIRPNVKEF